MTLTLAAVYAPLAFTPGRTGRLFVEFALTLAGAVIVSGFTALTLTPMMCSKLLRHNPNPNRFDRMMEAVLVWITGRYEVALRWVLGRRWVVLLVMAGAAGGSWWLFSTAKSELAPIEDRGVILATVNAPDGSTMDYTQRYMRAIERIGMEYAEFDRVFVVTGNPTVSQGVAFMRTTDWSQRQRSTQQLARDLQPKFAQLPGVSAFPVTPPSLGQGFRERAINFVVVTSDSYENLAAAAQQILAEMAKNPNFVQPDSDLRLHVPLLSPAGVEFLVDGLQAPMQPGECWFLDLARPHRVDNPGPGQRIHLVLDCQRNDWLLGLIERGLPDTPALQPGRAGQAFAAFRRLLERDPELARRLQALTDTRDFLRESVALGAAHDLHFSEAEVRSAMRQGKQAWSEQWKA